jgi:hypothetical protein
MIGDLLNLLKDSNLADKVNLIVTSTPGFSGVRPGITQIQWELLIVIMVNVSSRLT